MSDDASAQARGTVSRQVVSRRARAWKQAGLADFATFAAGEAATLWLTNDGMRVAGLPWRAYEPTLVTAAHRHAVGLVRAHAETLAGVTWICERELREELGGRPLHLPDAVVLTTDEKGKEWRTAIEVELNRKTEIRVAAILRQLLKTYDDVVYLAAPNTTAVLQRTVAGLQHGAERVRIKDYPPQILAEVA